MPNEETQEFDQKAIEIICQVQEGTITFDMSSSIYLFDALNLPIVQFFKPYTPHLNLLKQAHLTFEAKQTTGTEGEKEPCPDVDSRIDQPTDPVLEGEIPGGKTYPCLEGGVWNFGYDPDPPDAVTRENISLQ